jgi:hypothetical protein
VKTSKIVNLVEEEDEGDVGEDPVVDDGVEDVPRLLLTKFENNTFPSSQNKLECLSLASFFGLI